MDDETDFADRLRSSLEQLDEDGELDSENITFKTKALGGLHLDQLDGVLSEIDYDRDPVRITIEPSTDNPEDHHYQIEFEDLEYNERGYLVSADFQARLDRMVESFEAMDCLVQSDADDAPNVGYNQNGYVVFAVEAEAITVRNDGEQQTSWQLPMRVRDIAERHGASLSGVAFRPDGNSSDDPTYGVEVRLE